LVDGGEDVVLEEDLGYLGRRYAERIRERFHGQILGQIDLLDLGYQSSSSPRPPLRMAGLLPGGESQIIPASAAAMAL
jgi:hypothetical protein